MNRNQLLCTAAMVWMAGATVAACTTTSTDNTGSKPDMATPGTGGNGGSGGTGGGGGSAGGGGSGGGGGVVTVHDMAMVVVTGKLPFIVDSEFVSSGFMGDGATAGLVKMVPASAGDSTDCNGNRSSATAVGNCHSVVYAPPAAGGMGWGGVYWQYPANNWGTKPGFAVPPGATKVTFQARGNAGGEKVTFLAGGIIGAGNPYTDSLKASVTVTLANTWTPYSIDLTGQSYSSVLGAFGWTMVSTDAAASGSFFVDDISWQ